MKIMRQTGRSKRWLLFVCMLMLALFVSGCADGGGSSKVETGQAGRTQTESASTVESSAEESVVEDDTGEGDTKEAGTEESLEEEGTDEDDTGEGSAEEESDTKESNIEESATEESLSEESTTDSEEETENEVTYGEEYSSKDEVALYIHLYQELPPNFITKKEAQKLGWSSGSLEKYAPGKSIGGDRFGNYEGNLPDKKGRKYTECDIDTKGASKRGAKRIVFSNDGLIYYTEDHYETFELLYGEE